MKTRQPDEVSCDLDKDRETKRPKATMEDPPLGCLRTARRAPPKSATAGDADGAFGRTEVSALTLLSHGRGKGAASEYIKDAESRLGSWRSCQLPLPLNDSVTNSAENDNNENVERTSESIEAPNPALIPINNDQLCKTTGTGPQNDASSQELVHKATAAEIETSQPALVPINNEQLDKTAGTGPQNNASSQEQVNEATAAEIEASNPASIQINNKHLDKTGGTGPQNDASSQEQVNEATAAEIEASQPALVQINNQQLDKIAGTGPQNCASSQGKVNEATATTKATPISNISTSPKQLLNERYSKIFNLSSSQLKFLKANYYTTCKHDSMVKFAAIFTCPVSGEHFICGKLKNSAEFIEDEEGLVWYCEFVLCLVRCFSW
jgi:hypothetical protein